MKFVHRLRMIHPRTLDKKRAVRLTQIRDTITRANILNAEFFIKSLENQGYKVIQQVQTDAEQGKEQMSEPEVFKGETEQAERGALVSKLAILSLLKRKTLPAYHKKLHSRKFLAVQSMCLWILFVVEHWLLLGTR